MSPAVNDLNSDTLSPTKDNGVLGKLTNPVVNLLPVQQETVCKLAWVLNKISVPQSQFSSVRHAVSFQVKIFSPEEPPQSILLTETVVILLSPHLQTSSVSPTVTLGRLLRVVENDYSFVSFFNNISLDVELPSRVDQEFDFIITTILKKLWSV